MPTSTLIRGSLFAAGLVVGVGAGTVFATSKRDRAAVAGPATNGSEHRGLAPAPAPVGGLHGTGAQRPVGVDEPVVDIYAPRASYKEVVLSKRVVPTSTEVLKHGFPGPIPDILRRTAYVAAYDRRMRHPAWTAEHLTATSLARTPAPSPPSSAPAPQPLPGSSQPTLTESPRSASGVAVLEPNPMADAPVKTKGDRSRSQFIEDDEVPALFRAQLKDYFRSGYDRGHMVPAADAKISQQAMDETFLLSNIAPQVGEGFNRHYWAYVEDFVRRLTGNFEDVWVFTVPLYLPARDADGKWRVKYEVIGSPPSISVPTHFAKVILTSRPSTFSSIKDLSIGAFVLPNAPIVDETPLRVFEVPVESVERAAGLSLFAPAIKQSAKQLCKETKCEVIIRRFDDARKQGALGNGGGQGQPGQGGKKPWPRQ